MCANVRVIWLNRWARPVMMLCSIPCLVHGPWTLQCRGSLLSRPLCRSQHTWNMHPQNLSSSLLTTPPTCSLSTALWNANQTLTGSKSPITIQACLDHLRDEGLKETLKNLCEADRPASI
ncbi:hypothetical protein EV421DRAFT_911042 [Armillaria borealis]|uniref:Uncharacterized protein n=1 Tax=Armillaria borealis TaxID=47425 RepID=A0AA39K0X9_9AGAR|nr:hypothetical protein EV421DRAFT_911042 [Armillaria borealis]